MILYILKRFYCILAVFIALTIVSCSETDDTTNEFANWQERNDKYFESIYSKAEESIKNKDTKWKIINKWSKNDSVCTRHQDRIVVEVINEGKGSGCPLYTDSVRIHYEGRLIPSESYPEGYVFDCSWTGKYNPQTMVPYKSMTSSFIDGFTTALQNMHVGDRWRIYIPQELAYGNTASGSIPAYSTLVFDVTLHSYSRPGIPMPTFR